MGLSRLLLIAANSKKYISGDNNQKLHIHPRNPRPQGPDPYTGEVVLCFQLDDTEEVKRKVTHYWALPENSQRCDGIIFFAQDGHDKKVICCVEMKSTNIRNAADQLKATRQHFWDLLRRDLEEENRNKLMACIEWKACFYHHSSSHREIEDVVDELLKSGFNKVQPFSRSQDNAGPFLRDEASAESIAGKHKRKDKNRSKK